MDEVGRINKKIEAVRKQLDKIKWNCRHERYAELAKNLDELRSTKAILVLGRREDAK